MPVFPKEDGNDDENPASAPETENLAENCTSTPDLPATLSQVFEDANGNLREPLRLSLSVPKPRTLSFGTIKPPVPSASLYEPPSLTAPLPSFPRTSNAPATAPSTVVKSGPPPYPGLINLGHTCYVNSCVQALLFAPEFRETLSMASSQLSNLAYASAKPHDSYDNYVTFLNEFSALLDAMKRRREEVGDISLAASLAPLRPTDYLNSLEVLNPRYGPRSEQQDVQEFFVFLLASIEEGLAMTKKMLDSGELTVQEGLNDHTFKDIFGGVSRAPNNDMQADTTLTSPVADQFVDGSKKRPRDTSSEPQQAQAGPPEVLGEYPISHSPPLDDGPLTKKILIHPPDSGTIATSTVPTQPHSSRALDLAIIPESQELKAELELQYNEEMDSLTATPAANLNDDSTIPLDTHERPPLLATAEPRATSSSSASSLQPQHLFQGQISSTFKCCECERESGRPENFFDISLAIEKDKDLLWSLNKYFAKGILDKTDKYSCDQCRTLTEAFSYLRFSKLPQVLTIHLKRFAWTDANEAASTGYGLRSSWSAGGSKLNFHVTCPEEIDIRSSWITRHLQKELLANSDGFPEGKKLSRSLLLSSDAPLAKYQLFAIIYHSGSSTTFGHYTVATRITPLSHSNSSNSDDQTSSPAHHTTSLTADSSDTPKWAYFDDSRVYTETHSDVMKSISASSAGHGTAYILLYRRIV